MATASCEPGSVLQQPADSAAPPASGINGQAEDLNLVQAQSSSECAFQGKQAIS